jgi:hypothetical protein
MCRLVFYLVVLLLVTGTWAHAQTVTTKIVGAKLSNVVITSGGAFDPCAGVGVGDACSNGVLYGGTGYAGLGTFKYMTTPGHCSGFVNNYTEFTPTCTGATDDPVYQWANESGTTAWEVNTGVASTTDGASNTTTLAVNYTDTDAARYCQNMTYPAGGYTDWYLPAKDELNLILYAMHLAGKGNFVSSIYWSSTEVSLYDVWSQNFNVGSQGYHLKRNYPYVRCVRKY